MAKPPKSEPVYYHAIPSQPDAIHQQTQNYVVIPLYYPVVQRRRQYWRYIGTISLILLALAFYVLWPSDPDLKVMRLKVDHVHIHTVPRIAVDISLVLTIKVRNVDLYSMNYDSLRVAVSYRGEELGDVKSDGGHVRARRSSYVDALVGFDGAEVLHDVVYLLEDLAKGTVPFDTVTDINGQLGLFFFMIPLKARVACELHVNTRNQTILRQNCFPE